MSEKDRKGCLKAFGIGCLLTLIIGLIGGYFVYQKARKTTLDFMAKGIEISAEEVLKEFQLPAGERQAAMAPILKFTQDVRDGKVSLEQGTQVVGAILAEEGVIPVIISRSFEAIYVENSSLTDEEKQTAHVTVTRFIQGAIEEQIPLSDGDMDAIFGDLVYETTDENGEIHRSFKETLTPEELKNILVRMKDAADQADIENRAFDIDLPAVIQSAIEKGMQGEE